MATLPWGDEDDWGKGPANHAHPLGTPRPGEPEPILVSRIGTFVTDEGRRAYLELHNRRTEPAEPPEPLEIVGEPGPAVPIADRPVVHPWPSDDSPQKPGRDRYGKRSAPPFRRKRK